MTPHNSTPSLAQHIEISLQGDDLSLARKLQRATGLYTREVIENAMELTATLLETMAATDITVTPQNVSVNEYFRANQEEALRTDPGLGEGYISYRHTLTGAQAARFQHHWRACDVNTWNAFAKRSLSPFASILHLYAQGGMLVTHIPNAIRPEQLLDLRDLFRPPMTYGRG